MSLQVPQLTVSVIDVEVYSFSKWIDWIMLEWWCSLSTCKYGFIDDELLCPVIFIRACSSIPLLLNSITAVARFEWFVLVTLLTSLSHCVEHLVHLEISLIPIGTFLYQPLELFLFQNGFGVRNNLSSVIEAPRFPSTFYICVLGKYLVLKY